MGKTKDRGRYQSISLSVPFIEEIKKHIENKPEYRSVASFTKQAMINQMNLEKSLELR